MSLDKLLDTYLSSAAQAESSGGKDTYNELSGATGTYQFMPRTWAGLRKKYPELKLPPFEKMDAQSEQKAMLKLTEENAAVLERAGIPVNKTTLYAAHHFGAPKAKVMLKQLAEGKNPKLKTILGSKVFQQNPKLSPDMTLKDWQNYLQERIGVAQPQQAQQPATAPTMPQPKPDVGMEADRTRGAIPDQQAGVFSDAVAQAPAPGQQIAQAPAPLEYQGIALSDIPPEDVEYVRQQIQRDWTQGKIGTERYKALLSGLGTTPDAEASRNGGALPQVVMPKDEMGAQVRRAQSGQGATLVGPDQQLDQLAPQGPGKPGGPVQGPPTRAGAPVIPNVPEPSQPTQNPHAEEVKKFVPVSEVMANSPKTNFISINGKNFRRSANGWSQVQ